MAFGIWGAWKAQIDIGSSIVAVIAFGIIVDDTIHFLHRYRHFRLRGERYEVAIRKTFAAVGTALMTTTIVLVLGFGVLATSDFTLNSSMGLLTSLTIALALIVDFVFLPALLGVVDRRAVWARAKAPRVE
jgi:predicted RND superfamily exporter protein